MENNPKASDTQKPRVIAFLETRESLRERSFDCASITESIKNRAAAMGIKVEIHQFKTPEVFNEINGTKLQGSIDAILIGEMYNYPKRQNGESQSWETATTKKVPKLILNEIGTIVGFGEQRPNSWESFNMPYIDIHHLCDPTHALPQNIQERIFGTIDTGKKS